MQKRGDPESGEYICLGGGFGEANYASDMYIFCLI